MSWYEIMKEFSCRASSTWSTCDDRKEMAFTRKGWGPERRVSQLDYILGPRKASIQAYIHKDVKSWSTWDHYPVYAVIQEDDEQNFFPRKRERKREKDMQVGDQGMTRRRQSSKKLRCAKKDGDEKEGELDTIQRSIEEAAKKIAHTTRAERQKEVTRTPKLVTLKEEAAARCKRPIERKVLRNQARRARADHAVKCSLMPGKKIQKRKPLAEKECTLIQRQQKVNRREEATNTVKMETSSLRKRDASSRSLWTWYYRPESGCQKTKSMDQKMLS